MQKTTVEHYFSQVLEWHRAGKLAEAERGYRQILEHDPDHSDALQLLGVVALQVGNYDSALTLIRRAVELRPDAAVYRNNLGQVLERLQRDADARAEYETAIALDSGDAEPRNNLGHLLMRGDELDEAEALFRGAIELDPGYADPYTNLGNVLKERGELDEAIVCYRRAAELRPDLSSLHSNLLLTLHYHPDYSPEALAREHRLWAERHVAPLVAQRLPHRNDRNPDRRLRVGYVSPDFREHSVARFILPILGEHDRAQLEVFAYSDVTRPDDVTRRIRASADAWRDIATLTDERVAELVREDRIDILVDLAAHSGRNRLLVFARKPAPVQVTYLAYCGTTGVDAIDFRLTDRFLDPTDGDAANYSERSIRLPGCYWCYSAPQVTAERVGTERLPGPPTFGCLNNFAKVSPGALRVWARLLRRVPESRLLLHARKGRQRDRVRSQLAQLDVAETRSVFVDAQPFEEYLATYRGIDVALDPFPYTGGTTTCDALWMGVPVVSLAGRTGVSRSGSSLLSSSGLRDLVAHDEEQYVAIAAGLMRDGSRLATLRRELRARLQASPVMDLPGFTRALEAAFKSMWRDACRSS